MHEVPYLLVKSDEKEACLGNLSLRMKVSTIEVIANQFIVRVERRVLLCSLESTATSLQR